MMFDDKSAAKWPEYREELLNKYNGKKMFDAYTEQIKAAGIIK
jgi:putative aldouronate transport system substrate-binding protein